MLCAIHCWFRNAQPARVLARPRTKSTDVPVEDYAGKFGIKYLKHSLDNIIVNAANRLEEREKLELYIYPVKELGDNEHYLECKNLKTFKALIEFFKKENQLAPYYISAVFKSDVLEYNDEGKIVTSLPSIFRGTPIKDNEATTGYIYKPEFDLYKKRRENKPKNVSALIM